MYAILFSCLLLASISPFFVAFVNSRSEWHANFAGSRRQAFAPPKAGNSSNVTATIDFQLSNWWNNTKYLAVSNPNIPFLTNVTYLGQSQNATATTPLIIGVEVKEHRQYQRMKGLGASISDAAAIVLQSLRVGHPDAYDEILNLAFNESPEWLAKGGAGMNMIRTPIGASDFGFSQYTYDDTTDGSPDPQLKLFDIEKSPKRWQTIQDILKINPRLLVIASTWSPPAWMKNSTGSLAGGSLSPEYEGVYCDYLIRFVQALKQSKGIPVDYIILITGPTHTNPNYPTTFMTAEQEARLGLTCRGKFDNAGLQSVQFLANDNGWGNQDYPVQVFDAASQAFNGVAWNCHGGDPSGQDDFNQAYPNELVMMSECTRTTQFSAETWSNLKDQFSQLITGSIDYMSSAVVLWNLALQVDPEGFTVPVLPELCTNCLAPFLIYDNSTQPNLSGSNATAFQLAKSGAPLSRRQAGTVPPPTPPSSAPDPHELAKNVKPSEMNVNDVNKGQIIPPFRPSYYQTSDFITMAHLGRAIRPNAGGGRWAQRVGVATTEDNLNGSRIKVQLFRNSLGNGTSRWSLILLQWYDHYAYYYATHEDMTIQLKFRDAVATFVVPPGVYTMQWVAPDSEYEHDN